jgi:hypothetical protein
MLPVASKHTNETEMAVDPGQRMHERMHRAQGTRAYLWRRHPRCWPGPVALTAELPPADRALAMYSVTGMAPASQAATPDLPAFTKGTLADRRPRAGPEICRRTAGGSAGSVDGNDVGWTRPTRCTNAVNIAIDMSDESWLTTNVRGR